MIKNINSGDKIICISPTGFGTMVKIGDVFEVIEYDANIDAIKIDIDRIGTRWCETINFDCVTIKRIETIDNILLNGE